MPIWTKAPTYEDYFEVAEWTRAHLDEVVAYKGEEGLHVEYKDGRWLDQSAKSDIAGEFRRYAVGFANGDGGVLFIGISESGSPCKARPTGLGPITFAPKDGLEAWLKMCLQPGSGVFPALAPFPVVHAFQDNGDWFAVVVVRPAYEGLISARCGGRSVFPARFADALIDLDEWAVSAILHGGRSRPTLRMFAEKEVGLELVADPTTHWLKVELPIGVVNEGFVWADGVTIGLIAPGDRLRGERDLPVTAAIRANINAVGKYVHIGRAPREAPIAPFHSHPLGRAFAIPWQDELTKTELSLAMYVVARNMHPRWYSVTVNYEGSGFGDATRCTIEEKDPPIVVGFHRRGTGFGD